MVMAAIIHKYFEAPSYIGVYCMKDLTHLVAIFPALVKKVTNDFLTLTLGKQLNIHS